MKITETVSAKINLTLDVTGRLPNGYHTVEMIMQSISLADTVEITETEEDGISMSCNRKDLSVGEDNLVIKAARLFTERCGIKHPHLHIAVEKRIPMQAGMAGGSADAAGVLRGLNRLYQTGLSMDELCEMGLRLGADVPFCIRGGTMLARGIGEELSLLPPCPSCSVLICKPQVGMSTPEVYRAIDTAENLRHPNNEAMIKALHRQDLNAVAKDLGNVMEQVTATKHPVIYEIRDALLRMGALGAQMTGSGSAVFGLYEDRVAAENAYQTLSAKFPETFLTKTV